MRQALILAVALGLSGALAGCAQNGGGNQTSADDGQAGADAIKAEEQAMLADWKAKKADLVAGHYSADATFYLAGQAPVTGGDNIKSTVEHFMADPAFSIDFQNRSAVASGRVGYTVGSYTVTYTNPQTKKPQTEEGSYITTFRKQDDGAWKAVEDGTIPGPPPKVG